MPRFASRPSSATQSRCEKKEGLSIRSLERGILPGEREQPPQQSADQLLEAGSVRFASRLAGPTVIRPPGPTGVRESNAKRRSRDRCSDDEDGSGTTEAMEAMAASNAGGEEEEEEEDMEVDVDGAEVDKEGEEGFYYNMSPVVKRRVSQVSIFSC